MIFHRMWVPKVIYISWPGQLGKYIKYLSPPKSLRIHGIHMDVSENNGTPKSSILIGVSNLNHPFWGIPILETPIWTILHFHWKPAINPRIHGNCTFYLFLPLPRWRRWLWPTTMGGVSTKALYQRRPRFRLNGNGPDLHRRPEKALIRGPGMRGAPFLGAQFPSLKRVSCWYLGSMDYCISPIEVGWIRPLNRWNTPTY